MRRLIWFPILTLLLFGAEAQAAKNFELQGKNELSGGLGVSSDLGRYVPGGFKWFNDYGRRMSNLVWLNLQFNITAGGGECWWDQNQNRHCDDHWNGKALEFAGGVKLKWRLAKIPLVIHAKLGGFFDIAFMPNDHKGVATGFRGGAGARYFFFPTFGVGGELVTNMGPGFIDGTFFYATIDFNAGIEWRF